MASDTNDNLKLLEELLVEILLRSSVESLVRAKCVCKQWYKLIRSPNFALNHLEYQKSHNKGRPLLQYFKKGSIYHALFEDETLASDAYHDLDPLFLYPIGLHMEGPINGLYCLFNCKDRIVMWNPALKEMRTLPLPHFHFLPHARAITGSIGFGIDPLTQDYKLVLIRAFSDEHLSSEYVTVYSLSTNTWRLLDFGDFNFCHMGASLNLNSSFLNGTYYWLGYCNVLIAFDMWNEKFRKLPGPGNSDFTPCPRRLTLVNDKVALFDTKPFSVDIWVMLEEGVWFKKFSFTTLPERFNVLGFWKNYGFLFSARCSKTCTDCQTTQTVLYNANTHEMRNVGPIGRDHLYRTSIFYESLVSVDSLIEHKERCTSVSDFLCPHSNPYLYMKRL